LPRDVGVVLVAGGRGSRLGGAVAKQFQEIAGVPMLLRALRPFISHPEVLQVAVVLPSEVMKALPDWLTEIAGEAVILECGGPERMDSVERGLGALRTECHIVLSHDAARPFVAAPVIDAVIAGARRGEGAIAALMVSDTLKVAADGSSLVHHTIPRGGVWRAQTPQGFPRTMLEHAFRQARQDGFVGTDEASLVERTGAPVHLVPDSGWNLKVTTPDDLAVAELLARRQP
jgi:2-C-methyl-D-erythritol 4-phosphate cytidylyltransferase